MKRNKTIIIAMLIMLPGIGAVAQEQPGKYKRDQRISDQLKNGTAPGLRYGPTVNTQKPISKPTAEEQAGGIGQLRKGELPGANIARGGGGSAKRTSTNAKRSGGASQKLPSDQAAGSGQLKAAPATAPNVKEPSQGGVKQPDLIVYPKTAKRAEAPAANTPAPATAPDKPKLKKD